MSTEYEFLHVDAGFSNLAMPSTVNWRAQTFTVGAVATNVNHTVTSVKLYLTKTGSPTGNIIVSIRHVDSNNKPTGNDLCAGTLSIVGMSSGTYEIFLNPAFILLASTRYAIVIRRDVTDTNNYPQLVLSGSPADRYNQGVSFADGGDSGATWSANSQGRDFEFEEWGNPATLQVTTINATSISGSTATGHGSIDSLGISAVTQHGFVWDTNVDPTIALSTKTQDGAAGLGIFSSSITGLLLGTKYYFRGYATNTEGTVYGANFSFYAGFPQTQMAGGNIAIVSTMFRYMGADGYNYYVQGVKV